MKQLIFNIIQKSNSILYIINYLNINSLFIVVTYNPIIIPQHSEPKVKIKLEKRKIPIIFLSNFFFFIILIFSLIFLFKLLKDSLLSFE